MSARLKWLQIVGDAIRFLGLCFRSKTSLAAENLFLRKQLVYRERKIKPRRADDARRRRIDGSLYVSRSPQRFYWGGFHPSGCAKRMSTLEPSSCA